MLTMIRVTNYEQSRPRANRAVPEGKGKGEGGTVHRDSGAAWISISVKWEPHSLGLDG